MIVGACASLRQQHVLHVRRSRTQADSIATVQEWHKRVKLFDGDAARQIRTYTEAVTSVGPEQAVGKPHSLWCAFAHFYERHGDLANARIVFEKATQVRTDGFVPVAHL